jgi:hypothetical protein
MVFVVHETEQEQRHHTEESEKCKNCVKLKFSVSWSTKLY